MNQSTDSGHSNQSGATNEVLRPVLSRACRYGTIVFPRLAAGLFSRAWLLDCFPARDALNPFGLDSGLFRLTTNQGFLSSYSQTNASLFIPLFNLPVKNYITIQEGMIQPVGGLDQMSSYTETCAHNFWWGKKLADPLSFASGSQDVTKSNFNQTKRLLN